MDLRLILAIFVGKVASFLLKIFGSGATAAPGLVALKIDPGLVTKLASQLAKNILVSGTNGKTTTTRMVAAVFARAGVKHLHNRAGSNLLRGIGSTLVEKSSIWGKIPIDFVGLWETDEAVFPIICQKIKPQLVVLTNLFRDQLDRYGEIDTVALGWKKALKKLPPTSYVVLNADDATVASLGKNLQRFDPGSKKSTIQDRGIARITYFGLEDKDLGGQKPDHASDATVCPFCYSALAYQQCFVGHLGLYACPKCGQIQPLKSVSLLKSNKKNILVKSFGEKINLSHNLPGTYNLYNFVATVALATILGIKKSIICRALSSFIPAFGRVEKIKFDRQTLNLYLVKNPTGFNEVINTLVKSSFSTSGVERTDKLSCLIAINDLIADGKDVSWLWDVNFEKLASHLKPVIVSGIRAQDMALRLKYTNGGLKISIEPNLKKAIDQLLMTKSQNLYILPTYTALLEIRKILNKMGLVGPSWKD